MEASDVLSSGLFYGNCYPSHIQRGIERAWSVLEYVSINRNIPGQNLPEPLVQELLRSNVFRYDRVGGNVDKKIRANNGLLFQKLGELGVIVPEGVQMLVHENPFNEIEYLAGIEITSDYLSSRRVRSLNHLMIKNGFRCSPVSRPSCRDWIFKQAVSQVGVENVHVFPARLLTGYEDSLVLENFDYLFYKPA